MDRWFSSCLGPTFPNRRFLVAATAHGLMDDALPGLFDYPGVDPLSWSPSGLGVFPGRESAWEAGRDRPTRRSSGLKRSASCGTEGPSLAPRGTSACPLSRSGPG